MCFPSLGFLVYKMRLMLSTSVQWTLQAVKPLWAALGHTVTVGVCQHTFAQTQGMHSDVSLWLDLRRTLHGWGAMWGFCIFC